MKSKKVTYAVFKEAIRTPGIPDLNCCASMSKDKQAAVEMEIEGGFLILRLDGAEAAVPLSNCISLVLADEVRGKSN